MKGFTARERFYNFKNGIELIEKIKCVNIDLKETEKNAKWV